jgi:type II secretory pathway component PulK
VVLGNQVRQKLILVKRLEARDKLRFIGQAGIAQAAGYCVSAGKAGEAVSASALSDLWSNNPAFFKDAAFGDGTFSVVYEFQDFRTGETRLRYGLVDEESKININKADAVILEYCLRVVLDLDQIEAQNIASAIVDWRDADDDLLIPSSAESAYYRNGMFPYEAKNAPFEVVEELLLVKGMTQKYFDKLRNYITIYGKGRVNFNTASRQCLLALGLNGNLADDIISYRSGRDGVEGTADDNVFMDISEISDQLTKIYSFSPEQVAQLNSIVEKYGTVRSTAFQIRCISRLTAGKDSAETIAVIDNKGNVLYYNQG